MVRVKMLMSRLETLKDWQENNAEKIHTDPHLEGYNSAVNSEIIFIQQVLEETSRKRTPKKVNEINE